MKRVLSVNGRELSAISFQLSAPEREQTAVKNTTEDRGLKMEDRNTKGEINLRSTQIDTDKDFFKSFTAETQKRHKIEARKAKY